MVWAVSLLSMRLISHGLTPTYRLPGIHGLITFGKLMQPPWVFSALPPRDLYEASPKAISGRTSYLRVRLEFLRYPQIIPAFFNIRVVRTSMTFYGHFILDMDRSPGFGPAYTELRPFQTRFPFGSAP